MNCSVFKDNVIEDPFIPVCLRKNYSNSQFQVGEDPGDGNVEVDLTDNDIKDCNLLCLDENGNEIKDLDTALIRFSSSRQQRPYKYGGTIAYKTIYHSQAISSYQISVVIDSFTGTGEFATSGNLGWGDTSGAFSSLNEELIDYDNNDANGTLDPNSLIDSTKLSNSIISYWDSITILDEPGLWTTGTPTVGSEVPNNYFMSNDKSTDIKFDMDALPSKITNHEETCNILHTHVQGIEFSVTETDVDALEVVGTVTYTLKISPL